MQEVAIKTHLIITDIHSEYSIDWCGKFKDAQPALENGLPVFIVRSKTERIELNTIDLKLIEKVGKRITLPRGREAVTSDEARVYLKEPDGERLMCIITHRRVKTFAPMYDKVGYRI